MVKKIIHLIDENTDYPPQGFPLGSVLQEQASNSFKFAIEKLKQFCQQFSWKIP